MTPPPAPGSDAASLGEFLRKERERRAVTIEQVASATKINVRLLHALETDQYAELPAGPFVRGFVVAYARFLGLEPKELLTRFGSSIDASCGERQAREPSSGYTFERREGEQSRTMLWAMMVGMIVVGGVVMLLFKDRLHRKRGGGIDKLRAQATEVVPSPGLVPAQSLGAPAQAIAEGHATSSPQAADGGGTHSPVAAAEGVPESERSVASPSPTAQTASVVVAEAKPEPESKPKVEAKVEPKPEPKVEPKVAAKTEEPTPSASTKPDPLNSGVDLTSAQIKEKVIVKALEDTWVRFQVDGKPMTKLVLRKDRILVLRAQTGIRVQFSGAEKVSITHNGRVYPSADATRRIVTKNQTPTLYFPSDLGSQQPEPFPGERPLPAAPPPPPSQALRSASNG